jgi:Tol biopolymer transport system component
MATSGMTLIGTRLGRYEIQSALGAGGMGEVYRARDPQLNRTVAIKIISESFAGDATRVARFQQEARAAAALDHPNILAVHDIGTENGSPYVVSELLEGETLRTKLLTGPLPVRKAVDYALQIARGLAAAHDQGIVHRDLKPENVFITRDGRVKILDFGLAKLLGKPPAGDDATRTVASDVNSVVGTVGYMSPEQARGRPTDARSDLFALGAILYEMLSGVRAFRGDSAADTISAILHHDPPELTSQNASVPPALERIVRHCLEKSPEERFQSARDVAFDLESLSASSSTAVRAKPQPHRRSRALFATALLLVLVAAGVFAGRSWFAARTGTPSFRRLTFRRGAIRTARFAPDGQTIVYSAAWDGAPPELFTARYDSSDSRPLGVGHALVLGISGANEVAQLMNPINAGFIQAGTLARMPLSGGAARELLENVQFADWSPDGTRLAVVRLRAQTNTATSMLGAVSSIEYPMGKEIYRSEAWIGQLRISPDDHWLAFIDHVPGGDDGHVVIIDRDGKQRLRSQLFASLQGLAWTPSGKELWFTGAPTGGARALYAIDMAGKQRLVLRVPGSLLLHDIAANGRVLLTSDNARQQAVGLAPGETKERNIAWFDWSLVNGISQDGSTVLISETGDATAVSELFLRPLDGSPAVHIADGDWGDLSPDKKWVVARTAGNPPQYTLWPTGAGESRTVTHDQLIHGRPFFTPDGNGLVFIARTPASASRMYFQPLQGGTAAPVTPEGMIGTTISPDGAYVAGGTPRPVSGTGPLDVVVGWSADGKSLYTRRRGEMPIKIYRLNIATGKREMIHQTAPPDPAGVEDVVQMKITADGRSYAYSCFTVLSDLHVVDGLR